MASEDHPSVRTLTFYPRANDCPALSFSVVDIDSEPAMLLFARQLFATHRSAVLLEVFDGAELVTTYERANLID